MMSNIEQDNKLHSKDSNEVFSDSHVMPNSPELNSNISPSICSTLVQKESCNETFPLNQLPSRENDGLRIPSDRTPVSTNIADELPVCVFCGMSGELKLGQGRLLRFHTKVEYSSPPSWYVEHMNVVRVKQERCASILQNNRLTHTTRRNQHSKIIIASSPDLPVDMRSCKIGPYISLDGCRRMKQQKHFVYDGKPSLPGSPNAYFDCGGRPFGLVEELNYTGWPLALNVEDRLKLSNLVTKCTTLGGDGSWIYAHHCCASWSRGVSCTDQMLMEGVEEAVNVALNQTCSLCRRVGASISCHFGGCKANFHFICAAGAGCLQDVESMEILCPEHMLDASSEFNSAQCALCESLGDVTELLFCTSCGSHYHASCLEPPLQPSPTIRIGWQCAECKTCLICNESKDENKMLVCDICDKGFHTYCLRPAVSSIPKNGFKCERCRVCSDCGAGRSSTLNGLEAPVIFNNQYAPIIKWHSNYTLCDRCFHAHKRPNTCCPVCERAWRCSLPVPCDSNSCTPPSNVFLIWPGKRCVQCRRMVHSECDVSTSHSPSLNEEVNTCGSNYVCPVCRSRDSATPSEAASTTTSFRTSPVTGGGNSSNSGGDINEDTYISSNRELLDESVRVAATTGSFPTRGSTWANTPSSSTSNSTTPNTEPGKQQIQLSNQESSVSPRVHSKLSSNANRTSNAGVATSRSNAEQLCSGANARKRGTGSAVSQPSDYNTTKPNLSKQSTSMSTTGTGTIVTITTSTINTTTTTTTKTGALKRSVSSSTTNAINRSRRTKTRKITMCESKAAEEKDDHPSTVVLCRADDKFVLEQDICVACGSIGLDAPLLACAQCGQCYHSFCADLPKITRTMIEKGWRCLDCTVCEGCGSTTNESLLLLCDDCDISFHTYCLDPPLKEVPKGGWKCTDCVVCTNCGQRDPGLNGRWHANYSLCAPCASLATCPICNLAYREDELLIRCALCSRWTHAGCDQLKTEDELEMATDLGYNCLLCRELGADIGSGHAQVLAYRQVVNGNLGALENLRFGEMTENLFADKLSSSLFPYVSSSLSRLQAEEDGHSPTETRQFFMDGVVLSETGLNTIRQAMIKSQPKRQHPNQRKHSADQSGPTNDSGASHLGDSTPIELTPFGSHGQVDDEASLQSGIDGENDSTHYMDWKSPSLQSEDDANSSIANTSIPDSMKSHLNSSRTPTCVNGKTNCTNGTRSRVFKNLGIGGFRAKPNRWSQAKRQQLAAASDSFTASHAHTPDTTTTTIGNNSGNIHKRRRQSKKKSDLEDNYPDYLMKAFYGPSLLMAKRKPLKKKKCTKQHNTPQLEVSNSRSVSVKKLGSSTVCSKSGKLVKSATTPQFKKNATTTRGINSAGRIKPDDSVLDPDCLESETKEEDEEFEPASEDDDCTIEDADEEYEDEDEDGDLCDFVELKELEDEMDNENLDLEEEEEEDELEDLSATLNPATHQLIKQVTDMKADDVSLTGESSLLQISSKPTSTDSHTTVVVCTSATAISREALLLVYSSGQSSSSVTSASVSLSSSSSSLSLSLSSTSTVVVCKADPIVTSLLQSSKASNQVKLSSNNSDSNCKPTLTIVEKQHSLNPSNSTTLSGTLSSQGKFASNSHTIVATPNIEISSTSNLNEQTNSTALQADTPTGLNEAADLMFMDDYLFGFGDLTTTNEETDLNDITPQPPTSDQHSSTPPSSHPPHPPPALASQTQTHYNNAGEYARQMNYRGVNKHALINDNPAQAPFNPVQPHRHTNNATNVNNISTVVNGDFVVNANSLYSTPDAAAPRFNAQLKPGQSCLKQFVAQQDLVNPPYDNQLQLKQLHPPTQQQISIQQQQPVPQQRSNSVSVHRPRGQYPPQQASSIQNAQGTNYMARSMMGDSQPDQSIRKLVTQSTNNENIGQLMESTEACTNNHINIDNYNHPPTHDANASHTSLDLVTGRNLSRASVNTNAGHLPELSVSDIETQLGPSTGFELQDVLKSLVTAEPHSNEDSPKGAAPDAIFNADLVGTPLPVDVSTTQRINTQCANTNVHPTPERIRQNYQQVRESQQQQEQHQHSQQIFNMTQPVTPKSSLVTLPVAQNQIRPMQQAQFDSQVMGNRVQAANSQQSYVYAHVVPVSGRVLAQQPKLQQQQQQTMPQQQHHHHHLPQQQKVPHPSHSPTLLQSSMQHLQPQHLSMVSGKFISQHPMPSKSPNSATPPPPPPYPSQVVRPGMWPHPHQGSHPRVLAPTNQATVMISGTPQCMASHNSSTNHLLMSTPSTTQTHTIPVCCQQVTPTEYMQRAHTAQLCGGTERTPPGSVSALHTQPAIQSQTGHVNHPEHTAQQNPRQVTGHPGHDSPHVSPGLLRFNIGSDEMLLRCPAEPPVTTVFNPISATTPTKPSLNEALLSQTNRSSVLVHLNANPNCQSQPTSGGGQNSAASRRINYNKWEEDERLGVQSTIAPVLHANVSHPTLRGQYPDFSVRAKEISKLWRRLSSEERGTWVVKARNNRTTLRSNHNNASATTVATMSPSKTYHSDSLPPTQLGAESTYNMESPNAPYPPIQPGSSTATNQSNQHIIVQLQKQQQQRYLELASHHLPTPNQNGQPRESHIVTAPNLINKPAHEESPVLSSQLSMQFSTDSNPAASSQLITVSSNHMQNKVITTSSSSPGSIQSVNGCDTNQTSHQFSNIASQSPTSTYMTSPVNSRPPSGHQLPLPPPPPIWPPSTNTINMNPSHSPSHLRQQSPSPVYSAAMSPVPIRSPASLHAPPPTPFHVPHPYPAHGISSLTSPTQSPAPSPSPSNITPVRSNSTGANTPMMSPHPSPIPQPQLNAVSNNLHLPPQIPVMNEIQQLRPQLYSNFTLSHPATPSTPTVQLGNAFSAPTTPVPGSSPGALNILPHSSINPSNVFIVSGSSHMSNTRLASEPNASQSIHQGNTFTQSSNSEINPMQMPANVPVVIEQGSGTGSYNLHHAQQQAATQQPNNYSTTELQRQRLKEILAKQVNQRQVQHQHHQQLLQQQHRQRQQEQEQALIRHVHSHPQAVQQGNVGPGLVYSQLHQTGAPVGHQGITETSGCYPTGYVNNPLWQQHASPRDNYHSIPAQAMRHAYYSQQQTAVNQAQHSAILYQPSQSRPSSMSPVGPRVVTPGTQQVISPVNQHQKSQFTNVNTPILQSDYPNVQIAASSKPSRMGVYQDMPDVIHLSSDHVSVASQYGPNQQALANTPNGLNQASLLSNSLQMYRSNSLQRNDTPPSPATFHQSDHLVPISANVTDSNIISNPNRLPSVAGLEEVGFEPPIIVSRVAAKEKRYPSVTNLNSYPGVPCPNEQVMDQSLQHPHHQHHIHQQQQQQLFHQQQNSQMESCSRDNL